MGQEIIVQRALDEVSTLKDRIEKATKAACFVSTINGETPSSPRFKTKQELENTIKSSTDKIDSLTKRFFALQSAINRSNATTEITVNDDVMTVSDALLRKRYAEFEYNKLNAAKSQLNQAINTVNQAETNIKTTVQSRLEAMCGGNTDNTNPDTLVTIESTVRQEMELSLVDPLNYSLTWDEQMDKLTTFLDSVNSELTICNSTTKIVVE